jgi:predicted ATPase
MSIYARLDALPAMGKARAEATGRSWFLVKDSRTGRPRMTDDPAAASKEAVIQVFKPSKAAAAR